VGVEVGSRPCVGRVGSLAWWSVDVDIHSRSRSMRVVVLDLVVTVVVVLDLTPPMMVDGIVALIVGMGMSPSRTRKRALIWNLTLHLPRSRARSR
jgi:hypothetical protein